MKKFELSSKMTKSGRRKFKVILYQIFPDSCVDEVNQVGTQYQDNGITWIERYCEKALPSIKGMSLRCEFLDDERTELCGHGETDYIDGLPIFEDAVVLGTFTRGYIDTIESDDGPIRACIGEGYIDAQCYHNFVTKLDADIEDGIYPSGSIEIMHTDENEHIEYLYGYKEEGRIPVDFVHSGYALLGVRPADKAAKLVELNEKHEEENTEMDKTEIEALVKQVVNEVSTNTAEMNQYKADCDALVAEANAARDTAVAEKNDLMASSEQIQAALDNARAEMQKKSDEYDACFAELKELREELGKAKARERVNELNAALEGFTDEQKAYAQAEIDAFNADPENSEINTVVNKVYEGLGRKAAEDAAASKAAEENAAKERLEAQEDIFGEVATAEQEDVDIFN